MDEDEKSSLKLVAKAVSGVQPVVFNGLHEAVLEAAVVLSAVAVLSAAANVDNNEEALSTVSRSSTFMVFCCIELL